MYYCNYCGGEVYFDTRVCPRCGRKLSYSDITHTCEIIPEDLEDIKRREKEAARAQIKSYLITAPILGVTFLVVYNIDYIIKTIGFIPVAITGVIFLILYKKASK